jgi:CheY-like chemotaxis protein
MYAQVVAAAGALVTSAGSARRAVDVLHLADVVVTDVGMAGDDGVWLLEQIRAKTSDLPVIAVSGYVKDQDPRFVKAAFDLVLLKPVDPWRLCEEIGAVVSHRHSGK